MSEHDTDLFEWRGSVRRSHPDELASRRDEIGTLSGEPRRHGVAIDTKAMHGRRFGELVVIGDSPVRNAQRKVRVLVRCDCGTERAMSASGILSKNVRTCGTEQHRARDAIRAGEELVGRTFGALTAISALPGRDDDRHRQVLVRCACGVERRVGIADLRGGSIKSCGGPAHEKLEATAKRWKWSGTAKTYAMEGVGTGRVKIGSARSFKGRLLKLQTGSPVELRIIAVCDNNIEGRLHEELADHCTHGEWFEMSEPVMRLINEHMEPASISVIEEIGRVRFGKRGKPKGSKTTCKACGEPGHYAKTCRKAFGP